MRLPEIDLPNSPERAAQSTRGQLAGCMTTCTLSWAARPNIVATDPSPVRSRPLKGTKPQPGRYAPLLPTVEGSVFSGLIAWRCLPHPRQHVSRFPRVRRCSVSMLLHKNCIKRVLVASHTRHSFAPITKPNRGGRDLNHHGISRNLPNASNAGEYPPTLGVR